MSAALIRPAAHRVGPGPLVLAILAMAVLVFAGATWLGPLMGASMTVKRARGVEMLVMAAVIVVAIVLADEAVEWGAPRIASYATAVVGGAALGALLGWEVRAALGFGFLTSTSVIKSFNAAQPYYHRLDLAVLGILIGGLATFVHVNRRTAMAARRRQHEAEQARAQARRRTLQSELQALQARVEPMFLFGTLERIRLLYRSDAAAAGAMLEDLIVYLRAALPHLRESSSTVAKEAALAQSWLDIVGRTATDRQVVFDIAKAAREARLPALVMLPLVQQAVGDVEAGVLRLHASVGIVAGRLRIEVSTAGNAFAAGIRGQPLLEQIEERLRALYGTGAHFAAMPGDGAAVAGRARIELPLELDDSGTRGASR